MLLTNGNCLLTFSILSEKHFSQGCGSTSSGLIKSSTVTKSMMKRDIWHALEECRIKKSITRAEFLCNCDQQTAMRSIIEQTTHPTLYTALDDRVYFKQASRSAASRQVLRLHMSLYFTFLLTTNRNLCLVVALMANVYRQHRLDVYTCTLLVFRVGWTAVSGRVDQWPEAGRSGGPWRE